MTFATEKLISLLRLLPLRSRRRLMQRVFRWRRSLTLGVRAAVFDHEQRILLVRPGYLPHWTLPGGGVEKNETAEEALARELIEEAGVRLTRRARLFGIYANHAVFPNDHVLLYVVEADGFEQGPWRAGAEIVDKGFFAPDALPAETTEGTRRRLRELLNGAPCAETW